jgi:hypothetical protein
VRFGAFLLAPRYPGQDAGTPLDASLAAAVAAEEAGFDDVWIAEHHFMSYGVCPSAVTMAGFLLGATRRITVGTAVSVLSTQHPVALAEQAALLDRLSGGRFVLGVGRGGPWVELDVFGIGLERWERGYPAALDTLLAALRTGRVCDPLHTGQVADDLELVPRPRGDLPVITAVTSGCASPPTAGCRCCSECTPTTRRRPRSPSATRSSLPRPPPATCQRGSRMSRTAPRRPSRRFGRHCPVGSGRASATAAPMGWRPAAGSGCLHRPALPAAPGGQPRALRPHPRRDSAAHRRRTSHPHGGGHR